MFEFTGVSLIKILIPIPQSVDGPKVEDESALFLEAQIKGLKRRKVSIPDGTLEAAFDHGKFFIPHVIFLSVIS